jgi:plastocyanin
MAIVFAACGEEEAHTPTPTLTTGDVRQVPVELFAYGFKPKTLTFKVGETVEFVLTSKDIEHTFTVKKLEIDWDLPKRDETESQTFTFSKPGNFSLICTIPNHEALGMVGTITVQ